MFVQDLSYFETMDAERLLGDVEKARVNMIRDLIKLNCLIDGEEASGILETFVNMLESIDETLDGVYNDIIDRQNDLEDLEREASEAEAQEEVMLSC